VGSINTNLDRMACKLPRLSNARQTRQDTSRLGHIVVVVVLWCCGFDMAATQASVVNLEGGILKNPSNSQATAVNPTLSWNPTTRLPQSKRIGQVGNKPPS